MKNRASFFFVVVSALALPGCVGSVGLNTARGDIPLAGAWLGLGDGGGRTTLLVFNEEPESVLYCNAVGTVRRDRHHADNLAGVAHSGSCAFSFVGRYYDYHYGEIRRRYEPVTVLLTFAFPDGDTRRISQEIYPGDWGPVGRVWYANSRRVSEDRQTVRR